MNYEIFKNKKVVIFLPHPDDELNTVYGLLYGIKNMAKDIKVIYSTNGNYNVNSKYRLKEAINSLKIIGLSRNNIIFMGYSDQIPENDNHLYHEKDKFIDNHGNSFTSTPFNDDYHYLMYKEHQKFNSDNFTSDIIDIITNIMPDFIFGIDYDSHPDHRALSLSLERALGIILKKDKTYRPIVMKMPAYANSYFGTPDFNYNNPCSNIENVLSALNPYYDWNTRIRFKVPVEAQRYLLLRNFYFWGLLQHKSQYIFNRVNQVINSDMIFFPRETNNLALNATITTSSGNPKYLNDFMLFDSSNIMHGSETPPIFDKGYTEIEKEDKEKTINISFPQKVSFDTIRLYGEINKVQLFKKIEINKKKYNVNFKNNIYIIDNLSFENVKKLEIKFNSTCKEPIKLGEIEIIYKQDNLFSAYLMVENTSVNRYYYKDKIPELKIYSNTPKNDLIVEKENNIYYLKYKNAIIDKVTFIQITNFIKVKFNIIKYVNQISIFIGRIYQKLVKMIRNIKEKTGL